MTKLKYLVFVPKNEEEKYKITIQPCQFRKPTDLIHWRKYTEVFSPTCMHFCDNMPKQYTGKFLFEFRVYEKNLFIFRCFKNKLQSIIY